MTILAGAAIVGSAEPAVATATYTCTGNTAVDRAHLQPMIDNSGAITLKGRMLAPGTTSPRVSR